MIAIAQPLATMVTVQALLGGDRYAQSCVLSLRGVVDWLGDLAGADRRRTTGRSGVRVRAFGGRDSGAALFGLPCTGAGGRAAGGVHA